MKKMYIAEALREAIREEMQRDETVFCIGEDIGIEHKLLYGSIDIPLVIHGGTGFPKKAVKKCIRLGVAKFNVGTILKQVYYRGIKDSVRRIGNNLAVQEIVGSRKKGDFTYLAKQNVKEKVKEFLQLYDSAGKSPAKVFLRKK